MEEATLKEIRKGYDDKLAIHEQRLNKHGERLDAIEIECKESAVQIKNLIKSIDSLVTTLKWMIGIAVPSLLTVLGLLLRK